MSTTPGIKFAGKCGDRWLAAAFGLALSAIFSPLAHSDVIYSQNFDSFVGTLASLPAGLTLGGSNPLDATFNGLFTDGVSAYSTVNGIYAGTQSSNTSDNGFDARVPVSNTLTLTFTVTNTTAQTANSLTLTFNEEQYQDAVATPNTISVESDNGSGGTSFSQTNLTGNINSNELQASGTGIVYATPLTAADTVTYNQPLAPGASVELQYLFTPGGGGNRPIFGVDDIVVSTPSSVPEPSTIALGALSGIGMLGFLRRRRRL